MLDEAFVADCPYAPEAILFDEILETDAAAGLVVARMPTHAQLPFTGLQRVHPERHPQHVSGAVMVHVTGMLGFAHATRKREELGFQPPLDVVDGAARVLDPFLSGLNTGEHAHGKFFKDYLPSNW